MLQIVVGAPARMKRVRPQDVEADRRAPVEAETDDRAVAEPVAVRADRRQQPPVAGEGTRAVRDAQVVEGRRRVACEQGEEESERAHELVERMGTPRREARSGRLAPWTITEKSTTTNTIS